MQRLVSLTNATELLGFIHLFEIYTLQHMLRVTECDVKQIVTAVGTDSKIACQMTEQRITVVYHTNKRDVTVSGFVVALHYAQEMR